jgi:transposase, IS6 family
MGERGVWVDHSTIYRWVQKYAPEIERRLRWQWRQPRSTSWRVDETYIKVRGQWAYLYRAVDKFGDTIDFYLSPTRNTAAAKRFLGKALNGLKQWEMPHVVNTDKAPTYAAALAELKKEGKCPSRLIHVDLAILDELGYLPFSPSGGALLFHLLSKLYERTSIVITTNLSFSEWSAIFGDSTMS